MQCKIVSLASLITAGLFCLFCYLYVIFSPQISNTPTSRILESGAKFTSHHPKSKSSGNCETIAAKLCSIPVCVSKSFSADSNLAGKIRRSIKNSKSITIVHRHGTRIAFSAVDKKSCGRQYAPTELEKSEYFKNVKDYSHVFQFSKKNQKNGTDGQCAHAMLTGHGALQLFENGKLLKRLSKNAEWAKNQFKLKSSRYARTIGSLVSFAVGYGIKHDSRLSEFDISHEYGEKVPSECRQIVRKYEEATGKGQTDDRDYKKYKLKKAAVDNDGLCTSENFKSISGVLSDICHETHTSFMKNSEDVSDRFTKSCNDTNYFHRQQFMTKYCTRDLSIIRQHFILEQINFNKLNSKSINSQNTLWSLHDVNLVDLWCIFFWEKETDDCPPPISYAAFMLFTDSMVIFSNQNHLAAVKFNFMENPIKFTNKSIVDQIKNATRCHGLMKQFI